jgi:glyoxylase-like metal-dependent hydrolase (beta-lactamase superfamily II)/rhodanese-related sulfurtransferase
VTFSIVPLDTPTLGDRSYLVHDGRLAFVVDPQRDIDRVLALLEEHGVRLAAVFETHIHNDYLTGGLALARATGATYHVNGADYVDFERSPLQDGTAVDIGDRMRVTALATPGHTFTHLSYVLTDATTGTGVGVFTGGSLLYGATGRPDLLGPEHTDTLARHQHASAHRLADLLDDATPVFPTHGFGSFCAAGQSEATASTIGEERRTNPALTRDEEDYVRDLVAGLDAWPAYYARMAPGNAAGPAAPDLSPPAEVDPAELRARLKRGEWVVDLRHRTVFAAGHVVGTLNIGLDGSFATNLGWLLDAETPLTLLGDTAEDVAEAQRELVRIGVERLAGHATGKPESWTTEPLGSYPTATFADLADVRHHRAVGLLDVRRRLEHEEARIEGAVNIPLHELADRLGEVPTGEVWVHCAAGYRASVAVSLLLAAAPYSPRSLVAVDDTFDHARETALPIISG